MPSENEAPGLMNEQQFTESIYAKYQGHFDHYYELLRFAQDALVSHRSFTRDHMARRFNIYALGHSSRSIRSGDYVNSLYVKTLPSSCDVSLT